MKVFMFLKDSVIKKIELKSAIYESKDLKLPAKKSDGSFIDYILIALPFEPIQKVFEQLKKDYPELRSRGEAHITVITPLEMSSVLDGHLSAEEIIALAIDANLQQAKFEIKGLGSGSVIQSGKKIETFFLIVESDDLLNFRKLIHEKFIESGGDSSAFNPGDLQAHITVGFTHRDLHRIDGVEKDVGSMDPRYKLIVR